MVPRKLDTFASMAKTPTLIDPFELQIDVASRSRAFDPLDFTGDADMLASLEDGWREPAAQAVVDDWVELLESGIRGSAAIARTATR